MRTILDDHVSSAHVTHFLGHLILYLDGLKFCLRLLHRLVEIRIEIADNHFPVHGSLSYLIEKGLHVSREIHIYDNRERLLHALVNRITYGCHI